MYESLCAPFSEATGSVFHLVSEQTITHFHKNHLSYASIIAIYAPSNSVSSNSEAPLKIEFQSTLCSIPPGDMAS